MIYTLVSTFKAFVQKKLQLLVVLGFVTLTVASSFLRFTNLGYSELQDDEKKTKISLMENETYSEFFFKQRKGPMQFFVAHIPNEIYTNRVTVNELALRLPFTIINLAAVLVLYTLIYKINKNHLAAFLAAILFSVNGFVVGFSRIAQYQSLNMLFSFLALFYFADLKYKEKDFRVSSAAGALFMSFSLLSHWDVIFYVIPAIYFFIYFLGRKDVSKKEKIINVLISFGVFAVVALPFFVPYFYNLFINNADNIEYASKRVGFEGSSLQRHRVIFELYNPEIALWFFIAGVLCAILFFKRTWLYLVWFFGNFLFIKFLMVTPKTHIYNYVIPAIITSAVGFYYLLGYLGRKLKFLYKPVLLVLAVLIGLLYVQSYQIFIDHTKEYPFDEKKILWRVHPVFMDEEIITFGFPHFRNWKEVNKYIGSGCKYITNESKGISQTYVLAEYGSEGDCYYIVYIKRPFYVKNQNVKYAGFRDSNMVYKYERDGETLTKIYKMK